MHLRSVDGASVSLKIAGYQFPYSGPPTAGLDTDSNWLMIHGAIETADGQRFEFRDPCLLTGEAAELGDWLRAVALGRVASTEHLEEDAGLLGFLEPNLALSVAAFSAESVTIRVHLSAEAMPPWANPRAEMYETFLPIHSDPAALQSAADEWARETANYPRR